MPEKILVRKTKESTSTVIDLEVYVPSMTAPKGYIKKWDGSTGYTDVSLDSYKSTKDSDAEEQHRMMLLYVKTTNKRQPKVGLRLPRDYQQTPGEGDYKLKSRGSIFVIEDSQGVFIQAYTNQDHAERDLERLLQGKPI